MGKGFELSHSTEKFVENPIAGEVGYWLARTTLLTLLHTFCLEKELLYTLSLSTQVYKLILVTVRET